MEDASTQAVAAAPEIKRVRPARKRPARRPVTKEIAKPFVEVKAEKPAKQYKNTGAAEIKSQEAYTPVSPDNPLDIIAQAIGRNTHDLKTTTIIQRHMNVMDGNVDNAIIFMSYAKEYMIFVGQKHIIKFANHVYKTDKQDEIEFLRKHKSLGQAFWEGSPPEYIVKKLRADKEALTSVPDEDMRT